MRPLAAPEMLRRDLGINAIHLVRQVLMRVIQFVGRHVPKTALQYFGCIVNVPTGPQEERAVKVPQALDVELLVLALVLWVRVPKSSR